MAAPRFRPASDDVFYMYMPIAWRDSDNDTYRFGDFGGMTAALPYLKSLGVTALWMTPVFPSAAYHGYQHGPADALNPRFGNEAQLWSFVQAAHAESLKVYLDFVAYGISQNSTWFTSAYATPASPYDNWLAFTNTANTSYLGCCPYTTWDGSTVGFIHWDLRNTQVTNTVTGWATHWLDPDGNGNPADGVDGFRLDHVSYQDTNESAWGYDLPWWQTWRAALEQANPDVFTFAEQANWGSYGTELLPAFDATFTKPFEFAARYGLARENARGISGSMASTLSSLPPGKLFLATLSDHDVDRLATSLGDVPGRLRAAADVLLLQPLPPVMYFGDELGMRGGKRTDFTGDAADIPFREPFKWNAVAGPPMSNYFVRNAQAYAQRVERDHDGRSVEEQSGVPGSLLERYRLLAALRRAHAGLRHGAYHAIDSPDTSVWAFLKVAPEETLLVAINVGAASLSSALNLSNLVLPNGSSPATDVETGASLTSITTANRAAWPLAIAPYSHRVLRVRLGVPDLRAEYADANAVVTQDSPANLGDGVFELDQMFVRFEAGGLALGLTGNLLDGGHALVLFFDALAGGQSTLQTSGFAEPPSPLPRLSGMTMDAGFVPERVLHLNNFNGQTYVDFYTLASGGGGTHRYIGAVPVGSRAAPTGGSNANGLQASYAPSNELGITPASASGAASATDGFRILVPWADLGLAGAGPALKLMAMLSVNDGFVSNQFLPGLGARDTLLGYAPFSLAGIPGAQFLSFASTTDAPLVPPPTGARLALALASANPARGAARVACTLTGKGTATLSLYDVTGRRVWTRDVSERGAGRHTLALADGRTLAPGLYLAQLREGVEKRHVRLVVVR